MEITHLMTKDGARITAIHAVEHSTYKGVADWFFRADLEWSAEMNRGKAARMENAEIQPYRICYAHDTPEAKEEFGVISDKMSEHLLVHGKWLRDGKRMKDGRIAFWIAKQKEARTAM